MNKQKLFRQSILNAQKKNELDGKKYHVLNDQFYTVVDESYFGEKKAYFSLYNTEDMEYSNFRVIYSDGEVNFETK